MGQLNSRVRRPAGPVSFTQSARTRRHAIRAFRCEMSVLYSITKMTIQTKSIMRRRVNRARPSGLV
jgi:hypothetical protein